MDVSSAPDASGLVLDADSPWPGLAAYDEASRDYFKGRDDEAAELVRLIRTSALTVLYGSSGLGKSSLLRAGAFPALSRMDFLPVYLRADFSLARSPLEQMAERLFEEIANRGAEAPALRPGEDLWRYLHRRDVQIWSDRNFQLTPVLVFDQFEEAFTTAVDPTALRSLFDRLTDLIENRIPDPVAADRERRADYDTSAQNYRLVLSFREDFLPEFEGWKDRIPELLRNRMRLLPMTRETAISAVREAGRAVLADDAMASAIVDFVAPGAGGGRRRTPTVEPVLLSLCCYELNRRRSAASPKIDAALLAEAGENILETFYRDALKEMPPGVSEFIEDHLLQGTRFRGNFPRDEALAEGKISEGQLRQLTDVHRLLRIEDRSDVPRIELIHDRLVGVVRAARDARQQKAREAEQERHHEQAQRELARERIARGREMSLRRGLTALLGLLLVAMAAVAWFGVEAKRQARAAGAATEEAKRQTESAQQASQKATVLRVIAQSQSMLAGIVAGGTERALQQLLGAHRTDTTISAVEGTMQDAVIGMQPLLKLIHDHAPVTSVAFSPDGTRIVSGSEDKTLRLWDAKTGQPIGTPLAGHQGDVMSVAFSPDGTRIVSGSWDNTLRLWDAKTGQPIGAPLAGHQRIVTSVAFSPDGTRIVSGSEDKTLRLWPAPKALADILCAKLTRNMTHAQWNEWIAPEIPYRPQCPDLEPR